jgi:hypothetical protein
MGALDFRGPHLEFLHDKTPEIDLEGSLSSGKTVVCLWKELEALRRYPGIWILIARYTGDATDTLLRPQFEQLARLHNTTLQWNADDSAYETLNGSRVFAFGLKTQSSKPEDRYAKIRGLPVSRIYVDQAEQLPGDLALELRARLRPDIEARVRGKVFPRQLTFSPNPCNEEHWLAKQFPESNTIKGRKYIALSLFDNAHNLPPDMIETMLTAYPPEHPKHQTVILGRRGLNVIGDAVYENYFERARHLRPNVQAISGQPLFEAFEIGRHNPVWIVGQRSFYGGVRLLGGVLGRRMALEDFLPIVNEKRRDWFPPDAWTFKTCTSPMGGKARLKLGRFTLLRRLENAGYRVEWRENANAPDVRVAVIEEVSSLLRRQTVNHEPAICIADAPDRWRSVSLDGTDKPMAFASFAFEGGYVWDEHTISVGNKDVRQPHEDDEYANVMHAIENLLLNFCIDEPSEDERQARRSQAQQRVRHEAAPTLPRTSTGWMAM